ncbi:hypothetical protein [Paramuribaculum intestinale]|uniref:hypothetical protein n=1 Tax=Paramuribaculum intestinale TaxID=2094151 RepID=UPI0025A9B1F4|nr:hypothetical protein [Paramuribaculum intestinale]
MENLSETLKQQAVDLGLCHPWTEAWGDCDQQELIDKYKKGIDFCIDKQYPSNEFIKANFDRDLLNANLIFVDEYLDCNMMPSGIYILNGECSGSIRFAPWTAATVYVRHTSNVRIIANDFAKVFVRLYDEAEVETEAEESAVVRVYNRR